MCGQFCPEPVRPIAQLWLDQAQQAATAKECTELGRIVRLIGETGCAVVIGRGLRVEEFSGLREVGSMTVGGHQHIEYVPQFGYLREGSAPLVLNSPHGGMPRL